MTILDALVNDDAMPHVRVSCRHRWLVGATDKAVGESFFTVYEQKPRQKYARCLTETSNEDEAVRYLIGEK